MKRLPFPRSILLVLAIPVAVLAWLVGNAIAFNQALDPRSAEVQDIGRVAQTDAKIPSMAIGSDGRVYVGTASYGSLYVYDPTAGNLINRGQAVPGGTIIHSLARASDGTIFGGTNNNAFLFYYSPKTDVFTFPGQVIAGEQEVSALLPTGSGAVFGGTGPNAHVFKVDTQAGLQAIDLGQPAPGETAVFALADGGNGLIYGGTGPGGYLFSLSPSDGAMQLLGTTSSGINALANAGNAIYIGTASGHIYSYSPQTGVVDLNAPVPGERAILSLVKGGDGNVYGGTYPGGYIFRFDVSSQQVTGYWQVAAGESGVTTLGIGLDGWIFAGTAPEGHLVKVKPPMPDATPPSSSAALSGTLGANGWFTGNVTASLAAQDDKSGIASLSFNLDSGAWEVYSAPLTVSTEGVHNLSFYAIDGAGNIERTNQVEIKIDQTPPASDASIAGTSGTNGWFLGDVQVSLAAQDSASGVASLSFSLDGGASQAYSVPITISNEGVHTLSFYAADVAGNSEVAKQAEIKIDRSAPNIVVISPVKQEYLHSESLTVTFQVQDAISGVGVISATLDGLAVANGQVVDAFNYSVPSQHVLAINATDNAGNSSSQTASFSVIANIPSTISDVNRLFAIGEITSQDVANSLIEKLNAAQSAMDRGSYDTARSILAGTKSTLDAQLGKSVSPYAYKMLTDDINYVISGLPVAGPKNGPNVLNRGLTE